jgi:fructoselysine 6-kinase
MTRHLTTSGAAVNGVPAPVRLLAVGDNVVDQYPQQDVMYPGGNAVNVAVHARRLGARSAYLGVVGDDLAGTVVMDALRREGVDTRLTRVAPGANAFAVVNVVDGNRVFADGAVGVSVFALTDDQLQTASTYDIVHTGECSHLEDQLAELARHSRRLSFDFSERPWDYVQEYARHASVAIWSSPSGDLGEGQRRAEQLRSLGPDTAVVTLGAAGALVLQEDLTHRPAPSGPIVDTLGAGDAFIARFLVGLGSGEQIGELLSAATAYATACCASFGAFGHATSMNHSAARR